MLGRLLVFVLWQVLGNLLVALANLARLPRLGRRPRWVKLALGGAIAARGRRPGRRGRLGSAQAFAEILGELATDPRLAGVVLEVDRLEASWGRLGSLRASLARFRAAGKQVVVHASGPGTRELWLAADADVLVVDESAPLPLVGLTAEVLFFGGALARVGAEAELEQRREYKSFAETLTRSDMSPAHREATEAVLEGIWQALVSTVARGRRVDEARAAELLAGGPYAAEEAAALGLVDAVAYRDDVARLLPGPGAEPGRVPPIGTLAAWRAARLRPRPRRSLARRRRVQVLALHGTIVGGEGRTFPRRTLGGEAACRALARAREDRGVGAVVLHVDTPGGDAAASDRLWREVALLRAAKPVVAYFDGVAASGGYYLAAGASAIVAQPLALTGSIGVVAGKVSLQGLYERLGIGAAILGRGEASTMLTAARRYTPEERRRLAHEVDALYDRFVRKVAEGRGLDAGAVEGAARGRVWLARDAAHHRLVDALGDVEDAIERARSLAGADGARLVVQDVEVGAPRGLLARLARRRLAAAGAPATLGPLLELVSAAEAVASGPAYVASALPDVG